MDEREHFDAVCAELAKRNAWTRDGTRIEVALENGRKQGVHLDFFDFEGEALVRLYAVIGTSKRIDPVTLSQALRLNYGLPHGSLALKDDDLVLTDTLLVEDADPHEVEAVVVYLAEAADEFERTLFGRDEH